MPSCWKRGRPHHLEQVKPVFKAHKPVFIDKPFASTYEGR